MQTTTSASGQGRVVHRDGATLAVGRDQAGQLHSLNAMCTHLGCVVGFNEAEQTWDCPCHGSRFELDGTVLDGPASAPLTSVATHRKSANKEEQT